MTRQIEISVQRLTLYLERVKRDLAAGDRASALANLAEVHEISRRLWDRLAQWDGNDAPRRKLT
jgi:hypothetical protein